MCHLNKWSQRRGHLLPDLQKPDIIANSSYCTITFWALKAFFCSNIKSVLLCDSQLQAVKARDAIHGFVCIPMAIKITRIQLYSHNF